MILFFFPIFYLQTFGKYVQFIHTDMCIFMSSAKCMQWFL